MCRQQLTKNFRESIFIYPLIKINTEKLKLRNFRFEYELTMEYKYEFSIPVYRLYVVTSHTNLIPGASFSSGKQYLKELGLLLYSILYS